MLIFHNLALVAYVILFSLKVCVFSRSVGEIGGNMGLFLGCSLLTICEFFDFLVSFLASRNRQTTHPAWRYTPRTSKSTPVNNSRVLTASKVHWNWGINDSRLYHCLVYEFITIHYVFVKENTLWYKKLTLYVAYLTFRFTFVRRLFY